MSAISVAGLLEGEGGSYVVKTEDGSVVQYIPQQAGETVEAGTNDNGQVFGNEIQLQQLNSGAESGGQDLVSLAMESTKECEVAEPELAEEEWPDEIECQLIQKKVYLDGQVQILDFIMCNQCPRLFKTETLLWNHIKAKHKRRSYRRVAAVSSDVRRVEPVRPAVTEGQLEPGEIDGVPQPRPAAGSRSPDKQEKAAGKEAVYVVGLDKTGAKLAQTKSPVVNNSFNSEKFQRQKIRKRIYVDSNSGPFKCPGCDNVTFSNRRSLDLHMKRLHKAGIVECDECGRKVLDLKRHKEILHK